MPPPILPVIDLARSEFGLSRTVCDCVECTLNCHHIPGYLIPADLKRIQQHLPPKLNLPDWARQYLLASPGALVLHQGQVERIPTLVPARRRDGACTFLAQDSHCAIHPVAPFGCAFFDSHQPGVEADRRSKSGLQAVLDAWATKAPYALIWIMLADAGLMAPAPEEVRKQLQQAHNNLGPR